MRPNRLSLKSSMNTVLFVNATIGFSENLFLVIIIVIIIIFYERYILHKMKKKLKVFFIFMFTKSYLLKHNI